MEKSDLVLARLASSVGRRDEKPNIELAAAIVASDDKEAVALLLANLNHKNKRLRHDCIKCLYEIGERKADMITAALPAFLDLLKAKDNRMQWGGMCAISAISAQNPAAVYPHLPVIMAVAEKASVITRDHAVETLVNIGQVRAYRSEAFALLQEILLRAPVNQFPSYAEQALTLVSAAGHERLSQIIRQRLPEMTTSAKEKRLQKLLRKLEA